MTTIIINQCKNKNVLAIYENFDTRAGHGDRTTRDSYELVSHVCPCIFKSESVPTYKFVVRGRGYSDECKSASMHFSREYKSKFIERRVFYV